MKANMLKKLILLPLLCIGATAMAAEPECFHSAAAYMLATYGDAYQDDENLVVKKERYGKQVYFAARDKTSGTNHPVTLLMQKPGKGFCKVLTTYPVAAITPIKFDKKGTPIEFSAQDQGTTSHEIIYAWDKANGAFKPQKCMERTWQKTRMSSKEVPCNFLLEQ